MINQIKWTTLIYLKKITNHGRNPTNSCTGMKSSYKKESEHPRKTGFKSGEWIDRQHGIKIQTPTPP